MSYRRPCHFASRRENSSANKCCIPCLPMSQLGFKYRETQCMPDYHFFSHTIQYAHGSVTFYFPFFIFPCSFLAKPYAQYVCSALIVLLHHKWERGSILATSTIVHCHFYRYYISAIICFISKLVTNVYKYHHRLVVYA